MVFVVIRHRDENYYMGEIERIFTKEMDAKKYIKTRCSNASTIENNNSYEVDEPSACSDEYEYLRYSSYVVE